MSYKEFSKQHKDVKFWKICKDIHRFHLLVSSEFRSPFAFISVKSMKEFFLNHFFIFVRNDSAFLTLNSNCWSQNYALKPKAALFDAQISATALINTDGTTVENVHSIYNSHDSAFLTLNFTNASSSFLNYLIQLSAETFRMPLQHSDDL